MYLLPADAPSLSSATITALDGMQWGEREAAVYFWLRKSQMALHSDVRLLEVLRGWLASEWNLDGYLFVTNEQFEQQVHLFEAAGLQPRFKIDERGKPGAYLAYS